MPRYKYSQETGDSFKVNTEDHCDAMEDANELRQILDDLGELLHHSKFDDAYPKDGSSGGYLGTLNGGLDADKPASPAVKDMYMATDTVKIYKCFVAAAWVQIYPRVDGVTKTGSFTAGKVVKINNASGIIEEGSNTDTEVADAVTKKHTQNTDTHLGTVDQDIPMNTHKFTGLSVPASNGDSIRATTKITEVNLESAIDHKDLTDNPHAVTKTQVSLGNVTDDAQLKRAAGDINTFAAKAAPVSADLALIEDSADSNNKKKIQLGNIPIDGGSF